MKKLAVLLGCLTLLVTGCGGGDNPGGGGGDKIDFSHLFTNQVKDEYAEMNMFQMDAYMEQKGNDWFVFETILSPVNTTEQYWEYKVFVTKESEELYEQKRAQFLFGGGNELTKRLDNTKYTVKFFNGNKQEITSRYNAEEKVYTFNHEAFTAGKIYIAMNPVGEVEEYTYFHFPKDIETSDETYNMGYRNKSIFIDTRANGQKDFDTPYKDATSWAFAFGMTATFKAAENQRIRFALGYDSTGNLDEAKCDDKGLFKDSQFLVEEPNNLLRAKGIIACVYLNGVKTQFKEINAEDSLGVHSYYTIDAELPTTGFITVKLVMINNISFMAKGCVWTLWMKAEQNVGDIA